MEMQMEMSYVWAVVITGITVVFAGLVLLILFISAIGKIFEALNKSKKPKQNTVSKSEPVKAVQEAVSIQPAPEKTDDDNDEVIAVISAAVAMMAAAENKTYRIKSVKPVRNSGSRNAWAMAGIRENTNPF
ncbi:MAG: OadG family protein [Oscillospiraceae bacterium]